MAIFTLHSAFAALRVVASFLYLAAALAAAFFALTDFLRADLAFEAAFLAEAVAFLAEAEAFLAAAVAFLAYDLADLALFEADLAGNFLI